MQKKPVQIRSKRLLLYPMAEAELQQKIRAEREEHLRAAYKEMAENGRADPAHRNDYVCWAVCLRKDRKSIGNFCFFGPEKEGEMTIGYGIDPQYRGQGYGTELVNAVSDWLFAAKESVYFLNADTETENMASRRLLEKAGFACVGTKDNLLRYTKERCGAPWSMIFALFGISIGTSLGLIGDKLPLGLGLGMPLGFLVGFLIEQGEKKAGGQRRTAYLERLNKDGFAPAAAEKEQQAPAAK